MRHRLWGATDGGLVMKRLVLASIGALAVMTMMGPANAADIARRQAMPTKAPMYDAPYNWIDVYVCISRDHGWATSDVSAPTPGSNSLNGGAVGGTVGYSW